jgi:hypothetical protein
MQSCILRRVIRGLRDNGGSGNLHRIRFRDLWRYGRGRALLRTQLPSSVLASTRRVISRSAIFANIFASGAGGSAPKYRSSAVRSRKYSAIAFIVPKESSNPSSVHEKVPYETVRILLDSTIVLLAFSQFQ